MKNRTNAILIILFVFSMLGLLRFSAGLRSVDVVGLFASGALAGAALASFLMRRGNSSQ